MAIDQIKWIREFLPFTDWISLTVAFFTIFFSGMSLPVSAALVSHLVGYNMTWSTTVKTVEKSNFFLQLPIIWRRFWPQLCFFFASVVSGCITGQKSWAHEQVMLILTTSKLMPAGYKIGNIEVIFPMSLVTACHLLWPFALNPWFVSFSVSPCLLQQAVPLLIKPVLDGSGRHLGWFTCVIYSSAVRLGACKRWERHAYRRSQSSRHCCVVAVWAKTRHADERRKPKVPHGLFEMCDRRDQSSYAIGCQGVSLAVRPGGSIHLKGLIPLVSYPLLTPSPPLKLPHFR